MKVYLSRRYKFSASHRLHSEALSEQENRDTYGKCNNPHGHGHNYVVELTVSGKRSRHGMVCDLGELDRFAQENIVEPFHLMNLNRDVRLRGFVPTTENLCIAIFNIVRAGYPGAKLETVRIEETGNNSFEFAGHPE